MTPEELARRFRQAGEEIKTNNRALLLAASSTTVEMSKRIFQKGQNTAGLTHTYSEGEVWLDPAEIRGSFKPAGKPGAERTPPKGRDRKTKYFESYGHYRRKVGLIASRVTKENTGELRSSFDNVSVGDVRANKPARPRKITPQHYRIAISGDRNVKLAKRLEKRYGTIFSITKRERKFFLQTLELEGGFNLKRFGFG